MQALNVFHHEKDSGGSFHDPTVQTGFIQGINKELNTILIPDMDVLCATPTGLATAVPTFSNIFGVTSEAEIDLLTAGATTTYKARLFVPITPFLCQAVSEFIITNKGNEKKVLLIVIEKIK